MNYEWVVLTRTINDRLAERVERLVRCGWQEHAHARWQGIYNGACIMRRPKDAPRMWTESELKTFVRKLFDEDAVLRGGMTRDDPDKECPQCGKWLDPAMSCCPHCLAIKI